MSKTKTVAHPGLAAEMAKQGHTLNDLSEFLGCCLNTACRSTTGKRDFSTKDIFKLCQKYGKVPEQLFPEIFLESEKNGQSLHDTHRGCASITLVERHSHGMDTGNR